MINGTALVAGSAGAPLLVLDEPLSFWGGFDSATGDIIDHRHPQRGESLRGRVVQMPGGRGSSSASSVLAEAIRVGTAPSAIVVAGRDEIVVLGAVVAEELYAKTMPVVLLAGEEYRRLEAENGCDVLVKPDGTISVALPPCGS